MTGAREVVRGWLIAIATTTVVSLAIWLTGGFETSGRSGDEVPAGAWLELTRWDVRVDRCEATDMGGISAQVRVHLSVVNTWTESQPSMNPETVRVEMPNGEIFGSGSDNYLIFLDPERPSGEFDPGIARPATIQVLLNEPIWSGEQPVRVRFGTESFYDAGFGLAGEWVLDHEAGYVFVDCPVGVS